jgi:hypothetical protein
MVRQAHHPERRRRTNSNEINTNDKNNSDSMGNLAISALNNSIHCFYRLVLTVLNIWTFVFEICFGFRDSVFVFFQTSFVSHQIGRTFSSPPPEVVV